MPECAAEEQPGAESLRDAGIAEDTQGYYRFMRGQGCARCRGTGYRGRRAIGELLVLNGELRELIVARAPVSRLTALAHAHGMSSLRDAALDLVRRGETTLEEIERETPLEE